MPYGSYVWVGTVGFHSLPDLEEDICLPLLLKDSHVELLIAEFIVTKLLSDLAAPAVRAEKIIPA